MYFHFSFHVLEVVAVFNFANLLVIVAPFLSVIVVIVSLARILNHLKKEQPSESRMKSLKGASMVGGSRSPLSTIPNSCVSAKFVTRRMSLMSLDRLLGQ